MYVCIYMCVCMCVMREGGEGGGKREVCEDFFHCPMS